MARLNAFLDWILFQFSTAALAALVFICFAQVVARYVLSASFSWAEEVSILIMVWATWAGACLAVKRGLHLRILIFLDRFSPKTQLAIQLALNGLAVIFLAAITVTSKVIIDGVANMTFSSLPSMPVSVLYYSVPFGSILMIYYLLRSMVSDWMDRKARTGKGV
jgi:TRAP-type C4-dicarboxylate transport system permease small subunit